MTYEVPFPIGSTAYISDKYFCKKDAAIPCEIISYRISKYETSATCLVEGYGMIPFNVKNLCATPEEAIAKREAAP